MFASEDDDKILQITMALVIVCVIIAFVLFTTKYTWGGFIIMSFGLLILLAYIWRDDTKKSNTIMKQIEETL
jgi:bacteriorhodopsin